MAEYTVGNWADDIVPPLVAPPGPAPAVNNAAAPVAPAPRARTLEEVSALAIPLQTKIAQLQKDRQTPLMTAIKAVEGGAAGDRSLAELIAELELVKNEIKAIQPALNPLLVEMQSLYTPAERAARAAERAARSAARAHRPAARPAAAAPAPAAAAPAAAAPVAPPAAAPVPAPFNLVIPESEPVQMLFIIGRDGEKSPSQAKWIVEWRKALAYVNTFPAAQYDAEFAKRMKEFTDLGCTFQNRTVIPRGDGHVRGGGRGGRGGRNGHHA